MIDKYSSKNPANYKRPFRIDKNLEKRNIYTHIDENTEPQYKNVCCKIDYKVKKISRRFIYSIANKLSAVHGCGLFHYCVLLCNARSFKAFESDKNCSWLYIKEKELMNLFGVGSVYECFKSLTILARLRLIEYNYNKKKKYFGIFIGTGDLKQATNLQIRAEMAAINSHTGYVYLNEDNINKLLKRAKSFSEADIAMYFWINLGFRDWDYKITGKCPVFVINKELVKINCSTPDLINIFKASRGKINKIMNKLKNLQIIKTCTVPKYGTCIFMPIYTEVLFGMKCKLPNTRDIFIYVAPLTGERIYNNYFYRYFKEASRDKNKLSRIIQSIHQNKQYFVYFCREIRQCYVKVSIIFRSLFLHLLKTKYAQFYQSLCGFWDSFYIKGT